MADGSDVPWSEMQNTRTVKQAAALLLFVLSATSMPVRAAAQATAPTAQRAADLQLGVGFSYGKHDYEYTPLEDGTRINGYSFYGTLDLKPHYGVEIAFHQLGTHKDDHEYERTYEIGPRYVLHYNRLNPYARIAYGRGVFNFPQDIANLAYNMGVAAGGVDVNVLRHVNVRGEYEYQRWFGFPNHDLQPQMITVGVAYHF